MKNNPKKTAIIKNAIRCVSQLGIEGTSADVIARKMGIAQSGIFYYFPKQEDLFDSLVDHIAAMNHSIVSKYVEESKPKTPEAHLRAHLVGNLKWAEKHPDHVSVLLLSMAKTGRSRSMRDRINKLLRVGEDRIFHLLGEMGASDQREVAAFIHQALTGVIISYYYSRSVRPFAFFEQLLLGQIGAILASAVSKSPTTRGRRSMAQQ